MDPPKVQKLRLPATSAPWALAPLARPGARLHGVLRPSDARSTLLCADGDMCTLPLRTGAAAPLAAELCLWGVLASLYRQRAEAACVPGREFMVGTTKSVVSPAGPPTASRAVRCGRPSLSSTPLVPRGSSASRREDTALAAHRTPWHSGEHSGLYKILFPIFACSSLVISARGHTPQASNHSVMRLLM